MAKAKGVNVVVSISGRNVWLAALVVTLVCGAVASAQVWKPFELSVGERYEYVIREMEHDWDGNVTVKQHLYTVEVRPTGDVDEDGEPMYDVMIATTRPMAGNNVADVLLWGGMMDGMTFTFGNPFELMFLLPAFQDIEMEVGERTNIFGFGRVIVTEEVTVAGRKAVVVAQEQGEAGNRTKTAEWIVDSDLALPVGVRTFDSEGQLKQETMLEKYERL